MANRWGLNPFTGQMDIKGETPITNAAVSGTPGTASQINTGDPNTKGLIIKGNTYTPTATAPNLITGLLAWYKADAIAGPPADGSGVSSWLDSSGNGNTITDGATAAFDPKYYAGIVNSKPILRFDNQNDHLIIASGSLSGSLTTISTIFAVVKPTDFATQRMFFNSSNGGAPYFYYLATSGKLTFNAGTPISASAGSAAATWHINTVVRSGSSCSVYEDGTLVASGNPGASGFSGLSVGSINTQQFYGDLAEVAVFNAALSEANRQAVEAYLAGKYAITVASQIPQASNLLELQNSAGTALCAFDATGRPVIATLAGTPTGTPTAGTMVYDTTAHKLWVYDAGWKSVTFA